jgi:beta-glucosidase
MYAVGVMDEPASSYNYKKLSANVTTDASVASARRLSAASTVLLKNEDGILPLKRGKKIAVIGFGDVGAVVHGGGSGSVTPSFVATPLFGITAANTGGSVSFHDGTDLPAAVKAAQDADVAIVFVATLSHEGGDRASLSLDDGCVADSRSPNQCKGNANKQNAMVAAIAAAAPKKTVVVMSIPGAVLTPWSGDVSAVLTNFMPGQQAGNAIADVLFGDVNPSARLPITLPNVANETQMSDSQWPGLPVKNPVEAVYSEKLLVGYRYYDHHDLKFTTGYPFGHGLSYTTFAYSNIKVTETSVTFDVKNSGTVAGAEIAQLYLGFPASSGEPPKQLKGFEKLQLAPGASATKTFQLDDRSKSIWDVSSHGWAVQKGTFSVMVGSSSRDIRLTGSFTV